MPDEINYRWRFPVSDDGVNADPFVRGRRGGRLVGPDPPPTAWGGRSLATEQSRQAGCEWLHVDFDDVSRLAGFSFDACGFRPTTAGLIHLAD